MNSPSGGSWYVAQTKPRQESNAYENLLRQGYSTYLPKLKVVRRVRHRQETRLEPMFPRYLFFRPCSDSQSIAPVRSTFGISNIVRFGYVPAMLRPETLDVIQAFESTQNAAGLVELSRIQLGTKVQVMDGPLAGLEGMVSAVSTKRVEVLMHLLGADTSVSLPPGCLEVVE